MRGIGRRARSGVGWTTLRLSTMRIDGQGMWLAKRSRVRGVQPRCRARAVVFANDARPPRHKADFPMLFRRFENLIDVFKPSPDVAPPAGMLRFYAHYLKQVWPLMTAVLVVGFFAAVIEVALFSFLGQLIDMAQATDDARTFFAEHRNELLWMAVVALIIRPLVFGLHNLLTHQAINPGLTNLIRWQNHRYVLKQSLNFFQ